jgi:hypothetical protein
MSMLATITGLLAQIDRPEAIEALRRGFQQECSNTHFLMTVAVAVLVCGVCLVVWLLRRRPTETMTRGTHLAEGAHVLGLEKEELDDLRTVASRASVSHPAAMLLSPANLARAARAAQASGKPDPVLQERLDRLAQRLYGRSLGESNCDCEPKPPERVS